MPNIKRVLWYLKYVLKHKYYVFLISATNGHFLMGLLHDMSKFLPDEFFPYAEYYGKKWEDSPKYECPPPVTWSQEYDMAWFRHKSRNKHHWQYWCSVGSYGTVTPKRMPPNYVLEMIFDWWGAGQAQDNPLSTAEWFKKHEHEMVLHEDTRKLIYKLLKIEED